MGGFGGGPLDGGPPFGPATWWLNGRMLEGLPCRCGQICVCVCVYEQHHYTNLTFVCDRVRAGGHRKCI